MCLSLRTNNMLGTMKKIMIVAVAMMMIAGCAKKKENRTIIAPKEEKVEIKGPIEMQTIEGEDMPVEWLDKTYLIVVDRWADKTLPMVEDENGQQAYDNRIRLRVKRQDGSVFFDREFTKVDFRPYIDEVTKKRGVLLGIVFDRVDGDNLVFGASVGSPDVLSDEYRPMALTISRMGNMSIKVVDDQGDRIVEEEEGV